MFQNLVFQREKDEELLIQSTSTKYLSKEKEKEKDVPGSFFLTSRRVLWCRSGSLVPTVDIPLSTIAAHFVSSANSKQVLLKLTLLGLPDHKSAKVFEFTSDDAVNERDAFKKFIGKLLPKFHAEHKMVPALLKAAPVDVKPKVTEAPHPEHSKRPRPVAASSSATPSAAEVRQRAALLASDKDLKALHDQLVGQGLITEQEFWQGRQNMLENEQLRSSSKQPGLPSEMITDVRPVQFSNDITYRLDDPQTMRQILAENPGVLRAYNDNVPEKMTEEKFWQTFFQSTYFHRDRVRETTINVAKEDIFANCLEEEEKELAPPSKKPRSLDLTVDLTSDDAQPEGYGNADSLRNSKPSRMLTLIRRFNHHSAVVLGSKALTAAVAPAVASAKQLSGANAAKPATTHQSLERLRNEIVLHDLEAPSHATGVPLQIQDQRRYFEGHSSAGDEMVTDSSVDLQKVISAYQKQMSAIKTITPRVGISDATATSILHELNKASSAHLNLAKEGDVKLSEDSQRTLQQTFANANELLRHFWTAARATIITPEREEKLVRVTKSIQALHKKISDSITKANPNDEKALVSFLHPILHSLDVAIKARERMKKKE